MNIHPQKHDLNFLINGEIVCHELDVMIWSQEKQLTNLFGFAFIDGQ
jgi:hypothetical protein